MGAAIARALLADGHAVRAVARAFSPQATNALSGAKLCEALPHELVPADFEGVDAAVFTPVLTVSAAVLAAAKATPRLVFFSSHNVSVDPAGYGALAEAEVEVRRQAPHATLLRPTLIYGDLQLAFMPRLMRLVRAWPIVPAPGSGRVRLQPIYHEDLAAIAARLCAEPIAGPVPVGGAEVVTKRELIGAIAAALRVRRIVVPVPAPLVRLAARVAGARFPLDAAQLARLDQDRTAPPPAAPWLRGTTSLDEGLRRLAAQLAL